MSLASSLRQRLVRVLSTLDDEGVLGPRLTGDALRLWDRVRHFMELKLAAAPVDLDVIELACYALQLPTRQGRGLIAGRLGRTNLRDRCEQAAELLVTLLGDDIDPEMVDRATKLLLEVPQRSPKLPAARLLADAINLEDFGAIGLFGQIIQLGLQGEGLTELVEACDKRDQYGYWEARLKDGFHHGPIRELARSRVDEARAIAAKLRAELEQDRPA